jgi:hypothetical protein
VANNKTNILIGGVIGASATLLIAMSAIFLINASWLSQGAVEAALIAIPAEPEPTTPASLVVGRPNSGTLVSEQTLTDATEQLLFSIPAGWVTELRGDTTLIKPVPDTVDDLAITLEVSTADPTVSVRSVIASLLQVPESEIVAHQGVVLGVRAESSRGIVIGFRSGSREARLRIGTLASPEARTLFERIASTITWL